MSQHPDSVIIYEMILVCFADICQPWLGKFGGWRWKRWFLHLINDVPKSLVKSVMDFCKFSNSFLRRTFSLSLRGDFQKLSHFWNVRHFGNWMAVGNLIGKDFEKVATLSVWSLLKLKICARQFRVDKYLIEAGSNRLNNLFKLRHFLCRLTALFRLSSRQ